MRRLVIFLLVMTSLNSSIYAASRPRSGHRQTLCSWRNLKTAAVGLILVSVGQASAQNTDGALMAYPKIVESPKDNLCHQYVKLTGCHRCTDDRPYLWLPCEQLESPRKFLGDLFKGCGPTINLKKAHGSCCKPCMTYDQAFVDITAQCREKVTIAEVVERHRPID